MSFVLAQWFFILIWNFFYKKNKVFNLFFYKKNKSIYNNKQQLCFIVKLIKKGPLIKK